MGNENKKQLRKKANFKKEFFFNTATPYALHDGKEETVSALGFVNFVKKNGNGHYHYVVLKDFNADSNTPSMDVETLDYETEYGDRLWSVHRNAQKPIMVVFKNDPNIPTEGYHVVHYDDLKQRPGTLQFKMSGADGKLYVNPFLVHAIESQKTWNVDEIKKTRLGREIIHQINPYNLQVFKTHNWKGHFGEGANVENIEPVFNVSDKPYVLSIVSPIDYKRADYHINLLGIDTYIHGVLSLLRSEGLNLMIEYLATSPKAVMSLQTTADISFCDRDKNPIKGRIADVVFDIPKDLNFCVQKNAPKKSAAVCILSTKEKDKKTDKTVFNPNLFIVSEIRNVKITGGR